MNENVKNILEWIYCIIIALVLALLFRYFIGTPTIVKQRSMYPTLKDGQRLILNRTHRITKKTPQVGDIITFEGPSKVYQSWEVDQSNPVAIYDQEPEGLFNRFVYYSLELTKKSFIKRVIATEGQHVRIEGNKVYINGKILEEDYLGDDVVTEEKLFNNFVVPKGYIFAMGDNRTKSTDCREFGCVPLEKVEGVVIFRFWPLDVWGKVDEF